MADALQLRPRLNENPVSGHVARSELGKPGPAIGRTLYSAIKKAMGLKGRYVYVSQIKQWRAKHPEFREAQVYHRPNCGCVECRNKRKGTVKLMRLSTGLDQSVSIERKSGESL
jgi:hypothetical protein